MNILKSEILNTVPFLKKLLSALGALTERRFIYLKNKEAGVKWIS